jgi:hypothetical protein
MFMQKLVLPCTTQHPAAHTFPAQQGWPGPPHFEVHPVLGEHTRPPEHDPFPQHDWPSLPQVEHDPSAEHVPSIRGHVASVAMHTNELALSGRTQHPLVQPAPSQQGSPKPPQCVHVWLAQARFVPPQASPLWQQGVPRTPQLTQW